MAQAQTFNLAKLPDGTWQMTLPDLLPAKISDPLAKGLSTSEGKLTSIGGILYTLLLLAESIVPQYVPVGTADKLFPVLGLIGLYTGCRTGLKAFVARKG